MATFLNHNDLIIDNLNINVSLTPFTINVPDNWCILCVLYGAGTGCGLNGLGSNPIENSIIAMTGELITSTSIHSSTLVHPESVFDTQELVIPSND